MADLRRIRIYEPSQGFAGQTSLTLSELAALSDDEAAALGGRVPLLDRTAQFSGQTSMTVDEFVSYMQGLEAEDLRRIWLQPSYSDRSGSGSFTLTELHDMIGSSGGGEPEPEPDSSMFDFSDPGNTVNIFLLGF